ncbi:MAG: DNA cytosine methyltransferase [Thaumarchaeota archaeon]|nr:DNA cytosine methyltransferase [Nitrososphaerota archaeon]
MKELTVIDLFCGAGGFSEGFKQMGFDVTYAIDNWNPAIEAHKLNQPEAETMKADVETLDPKLFLDHRPDVLIGGPPCQEFSGSKRGGGGDVQKGMRLVLAFFRFVHILKPRYWVMENVPRLLQTLPHRVRLQDMGIAEDGFFDIPRREVFNSADFGAPQKRFRLLSGRYPSPIQTHFEESMLTLDNLLYQPWVPMRKIIEAFPNPLGRARRGRIIQDPNYDLTIKAERLEDHFTKPEEALMTKAEAERNRKQKVAHAYYGKMKFPDDLDRPSRTVMATQFNASRETMVIAVRYKGEVRYRKPTVRECASLQCYPLTYRFPAKTLTTKYKLVGNSVPVKLAVAIAKAMLKEEGMRVPERPALAVML